MTARSWIWVVLGVLLLAFGGYRVIDDMRDPVVPTATYKYCTDLVYALHSDDPMASVSATSLCDTPAGVEQAEQQARAAGITRVRPTEPATGLTPRLLLNGLLLIGGLVCFGVGVRGLLQTRAKAG